MISLDHLLDRMLRWSLKRDAAVPAASGCGCGKGGPGDAAR